MLPGGQLSQVVSPALLVNVPEVQGVGEGLAERGHMNPGSRVDEKNSVCKTCSFFLYRKGVRNNWKVTYLADIAGGTVLWGIITYTTAHSSPSTTLRAWVVGNLLCKTTRKKGLT